MKTCLEIIINYLCANFSVAMKFIINVRDDAWFSCFLFLKTCLAFGYNQMFVKPLFLFKVVISENIIGVNKVIS